MAIKSIGTIKIIDVHKSDLSSETFGFLDSNYRSYEDVSSDLNEHIINVHSYFNGDTEILDWMLSNETSKELEELRKLLEENEAQYIRLVTI